MSFAKEELKILQRLNVNPEVLRKTSKDRIVLSVMVDCSPNEENQYAAIKFRTYRGYEETIYLDNNQSIELCDALANPFINNRFEDRRKKQDDKEPNEAQIGNFLIYQPDFEPEELEKIPLGAKVKAMRTFEYDNAFIFVIMLDNDTVHTYIVPDQVSIYLYEYFKQLKSIFISK